MKKLLFFIVCMFACSVVVTELKAQSQSEPVVYKGWTMLGESKTLVDVSYRIIKCGSTAQIHLSIFNENPKDQVTQFELEFTDATRVKKDPKAVSFSLKAAKIYKALCDSDTSLDTLKIDLPADLDPATVEVRITFK